MNKQQKKAYGAGRHKILEETGLDIGRTGRMQCRKPNKTAIPKNARFAERYATGGVIKLPDSDTVARLIERGEVTIPFRVKKGEPIILRSPNLQEAEAMKASFEATFPATRGIVVGMDLGKPQEKLPIDVITVQVGLVRDERRSIFDLATSIKQIACEDPRKTTHFALQHAADRLFSIAETIGTIQGQLEQARIAAGNRQCDLELEISQLKGKLKQATKKCPTCRRKGCTRKRCNG